ncbi:MAG: RHS repeat protein [Candidatus Obscuribacter sp.]|nr:RHS repeat protein [Candidatus Obscuribacter sp.]MBK9204878.1 RHS repeat protein [Candidatus Obscuribacter sp.]MBK9620637.1 RHS repeat protein [Candidatus Obscuribacter sp.]
MAADSFTVTYDSLGRIHIVTYLSGKTITYSYDANGNRTAVVST